MRTGLALPALLMMLLGIISALVCTENGCADHLDYGSCGNACCKLWIKTSDRPEVAASKMNSTFLAGGPDKQYSAAPMAGGTVGFEDLRQYHIPADFLGQSYHVTDKGTYTDTQNWVVYNVDDDSEMKSKIVAFSISQIGGAYGDDGQNWYNLAQIFMSLWPNSEIGHVDKSCMTTSS